MNGDFSASLFLADAHPLATLNATLNGLATLLLIGGWALIRRRRVDAHRNTMLTAFGVSVAFLTSYLIYHFGVLGGKSVRFQGPDAVRVVYLAILISHIVLAALVPFLAVATIVQAFRGRIASHRTLARWTLPIWLYVSVTGVVIYLLVYQIYPG